MNSSSLRTARPCPSRASSLEASTYRTPLSIAVAVAAAVAFGNPAQAATKTWNNSGTDWNTAGNWTGGTPTASDIAQFNSTFSNQPSLGAAGSAGAIWATSGLGQDVTIDGAGILTLAGNLIAANGPGGLANTAILLDDSANHNLTINAPITISSATSFTNNSAGTVTISSLNQNSKALSLTGNNASGIIAIGSLSSPGSLTINTSGTVKLSGTVGNTTLTSGTLDIGSGLTVSQTTAAAGTTITTSTTGTSTLSHTSNTAFTLNGTIQDGGVGKVLAVSSTNNILTLTGNNSYSGGTTAGGSTLILGSNTALGTGLLTVSPNVTVKSNSDTGWSLANNVTLSGSVTFGSTTVGETGSLSFGALTKSSSNNLTVNNAQTSFAGVLGSGGITKLGNGALIIGNAVTSTYTGNFTVSAGALLVNTDLSSASGGTVASGATVGGSGTLGGNWTTTGNLSPGNSPGTLAVENNLTINNGSVYFFEGGDLVTVGGTLDLNDNWTLSLGGGLMDGGSVTIFTFATLAASPDLVPTFDIANLGFAPTGSLSLSQVGNSIVLNGVSVAVIPEPSSVMLALGSAGALLWTGRSRRRIF